MQYNSISSLLYKYKNENVEQYSTKMTKAINDIECKLKIASNKKMKIFKA